MSFTTHTQTNCYSFQSREISDRFHCTNTIHEMKVKIILVEKIGHGGQAEVFKAKRGLDVVVVKMFLDAADEDWKREVEFASQVHCGYIVQFYGVEHDRLIMEYVGRDLSDSILAGLIEDWEIKTRITRQVALGLAYLHGQGILHCDIKSANILLTKNLDAKICDFGRARLVGQSGKDGTLPWMAPELFSEPPQYSCKSDVYALGMVMWEMASGCTHPYQEHGRDYMICCIVNGILEIIPDNMPEPYRAVMTACWKQDPQERPAASEIFPDVNDTLQRDDSDVDNQGNELKKKLRFPWTSGSDDARKYAVLGNIYSEGLAVRKDYRKAMQWFLKASDAGESTSMANIGQMYYNGHGVEQDYSKAMEWYLKSCDAGYSVAMVFIAKMYSGGWGVEQDYTKAMAWFLKASDAGFSDAQFNIGAMYYSGQGVGQDYAKAMAWFLKASNSGYSDAQFIIGLMYDKGHGVEQDYTKAMEWYIKASDAGYSDAQFNIGLMYHKGHGVEQDYTKAMAWYIEANDTGSSDAKFNIGVMHYNGHGVEQDYTKAMVWYLDASDAGHSGAQVAISELFHDGNGVEQDDAQAVEWYLKARDGADSQTMFYIFNMYIDGWGVEKNGTKAMVWCPEDIDTLYSDTVFDFDLMVYRVSNKGGSVSRGP